jgi:hypothetical protein
MPEAPMLGDQTGNGWAPLEHVARIAIRTTCFRLLFLHVVTQNRCTLLGDML